MNIFSQLPAGDSATWRDGAYTAADGTMYTSASHTLRYELRGPSAPLTLTAAADGTGWVTTLTPVQSAALVAGTWFWSAFLSATGVRVTAGQGALAITPNLAVINDVYDGRSQAEKALADAETALATFKSTAGRVKKYTIGSRSMEFDATADIITIISYWRGRVQNEQTAKQIAQGLGNPRRLMVRFT